MSETTRSPKELMHFIVAAGGNLPLAAERAGVSRGELTALVTGDDTSSLTDSLRGMLLLQLFDDIQQTRLALRAALPYMSPGDIAKAYGGQLQAFATLSQQPSPELNAEVHDAMAAKQNLITKLDAMRKRKVIEVEATIEEVS